ncbi:MAG: sugar MFS transporter [Paludibacteraceae bacterium]|nr:sugar MFS transporter [Paludibacteraceae bacterium]
MENTDKKNYSAAIVTLTSLFFMWGFITCLNDLLTPFLKGVFDLTYFQANLVQFAFFAAYFVISLIYFMVSSTFGDPIQKVGYKNTLVAGLLIAAAACFLFFMEAGSENPKFGLFLMALFMLGTGFTFLQIAANPLVSLLGTSETASSRLNMSQAFNSLGTTLAPVVGGYFIFTYFKEEGATQSASAVQIPYLVLASVLLVLAGVLFFSNVPNKVGEKVAEVRGAGALKHPYLVFGMIGIFCYVGAEVSIGNNLIGFMGSSCGIATEVATTYLMFYWGGAMIGRFMGAISMSQMPSSKKYMFMAIAGVLTTCIIVAIANSKEGFDLGQVAYFVMFLVLNFLVFISAKSLPSRTLGFFAIINVVLLLVMLLCGGSISLWAILSIGLFNSIMFSNVFTLAIDGLEEYTAQGSSLLVMMILGGAIVPPVQGLLTDYFHNNSPESLKFAFLVPLVCYIYLAWYGFVGSGIGKKKNIVVKKEEHPESIVLRND